MNQAVKPHEEPLISQPMRPIETLEAPKFAMPGGACDTHMHVFGPLDKYPCVEHPHYTLPDGKIDHYQRLMPVLGIDRLVIVQPSFYGTDNTCLLDNLAIAGDCARGVATLDADVSTAELGRLHTSGVRAVRLDIFKRASLPLAEIQAYIMQMAAKVAPLKWHLQFYAPGWRVRDLIDFMRHLDIDFVIDHMGYMLEEDGLTDADFAKLIELMKSGHCHVKLSAPYRLAKKRGYKAVEEVAKTLVRTAPEKIIWGSDWPHIPEGGRDTGEILNLLPTWAPGADVREQILTENPRRLFGFA
jgi:predicted TIM-barrel fold metal-dependent hydrolase